jgi:CHAT domain-containing protein
MDESEQIIVQLAETYKKPDEFINIVEKLFEVSPNEKGNLFLQVGNVLYKFSYFSLALNSWSRALMYFIKNNDKIGESSCYTNLGNTYLSLGDYGKAIEYHEKSLEIDKDIGDRAGESSCYANLGNTYGSLGDYGKAIEYHEKSLEIFTDIGDRAGESSCYTTLGNAYASLGDYGKAIEYHEKSLEIKKDIGDIDSERVVSYNLGQIYDESDKPELAYEYYNHSIELSERMGGRLVEEKHKIGYYASASEAYQGMIPLCLKLDSKEGEAFEYTERSKSRAFLDLIANTEIKPSVELTSELKSLLDDEEMYLSKLREIQMRHLSQTKVSMELGEVEGIFRKLDKIYDEIEEHDLEYVFTRKGKPLSMDKVQNLLSSQRKDGNAVLIEYFITRDKTFIFVVSSKDKELHVKTVPISWEKLNRYVEVYWREVVDYHEFQDIGDTWLGLSDYLIEPISEYLCEGDLIYFVPYGLLHYLPIHALELNGEPVIKKHPVAYSPSASLLKFCQNKGSGRLQSCASFGVVFEEEAKDVAELFNTNPYNGYSATKDKVLENCTDKDIIHFSCHGGFDDKDPLSSGVELYEGVLTAREIFDMRWNTELVTLSACQTGLNQRSPGDDLIGLTRAFIYAGAPSVIVSLWSVDAHSTQELMHEFYTLLKNGTDKATALQEAQKKIMEKEGYSHPYYWAPFVLVGDWE